MSVNLAKQAFLKRKAAGRKSHASYEDEEVIDVAQPTSSLGSELKQKLQSVQECQEAIEKPKEPTKPKEEEVTIFDDEEELIKEEEEKPTDSQPEEVPVPKGFKNKS